MAYARRITASMTKNTKKGNSTKLSMTRKKSSVGKKKIKVAKK